MERPKPGKKGRKIGRNKDACARYRAQGRREKGKAKRLVKFEVWLESRQANETEAVRDHRRVMRLRRANRRLRKAAAKTARDSGGSVVRGDENA